MSVSDTPESGLRIDRLWWLREDVTGEIDADPAWMAYSDNLQNFNWAPAGGTYRKDGLGTPDPAMFNKGNEEHEITVAYDLQRAIVDGNGGPLDAVGDAMLRNADNEIPNTHALFSRETRETTSPRDPADVDGIRKYTVAKGGKADWSLEGDPEEGAPVPIELTYSFEKARTYLIRQPAAAELLAVRSTDTDDSTQSLTIESEGGASTESVTLDGTNLVSTSTTFDDIDALELDEETDGNVVVFINTGDETAPAEGTELSTIYGALEYSNDDQPVEGDLGVPALGAGSAPAEIGTAFEHFLGDSVQRPAGQDFTFDLNNLTVEGDNGLDATTRHDSVRKRWTAGNRETSITADVVGDRVTHDYIMEALRSTGADLVWTLSNSQLTFPDANIPDGEEPERTREEDQAAAAVGIGFESKGVNVTQV